MKFKKLFLIIVGITVLLSVGCKEKGPIEAKASSPPHSQGYSYQEDSKFHLEDDSETDFIDPNKKSEEGFGEGMKEAEEDVEDEMMEDDQETEGAEEGFDKGTVESKEDDDEMKYAEDREDDYDDGMTDSEDRTPDEEEGYQNMVDPNESVGSEQEVN